MCAVLIGLLGLIPGIIYLCIRKNNSNSVSSVQQICIGCRAPIAAGTNICPYCGAQQPPMNPYLAAGLRSPEECALCHARAKKLLIAGIICFALSIISIIVMVVAIIGAAAGNLSLIHIWWKPTSTMCWHSRWAETPSMKEPVCWSLFPKQQSAIPTSKFPM